MKRNLLILLFFVSFFGFSQFNKKAPWNVQSDSARTQKQTIDDAVALFNAYWETHDKSKKGSGYKPFMRWENHWRNKVDPQGYLITPQKMWQAFNQKKVSQQFRANSSLSLPVSDWQPVGPFTHTNTGSWSSGQGRVNTVLVDPSNASVVYMGTPAGGIWKSVNSGDSWTPLGDNLPQIGVSGIAVDYSNSNTIYIATGDCDAWDTYSVGVMKSTDGGTTWNSTGLTFTTTDKNCGDIIIHPTNSNILWVATTDGIYKTTNAGVNWTLVQADDFSQGRIRLKPGDPNTIYAVSRDKFYRSTNGGTSFSAISGGLPASSGRRLLDVTPANPNYVYILSTTNSYDLQGVYRSVNGGTNWTKTSGNTDIFESSQAWYDLAFAVSPTNADEVYTGCLNIWKSTNGGANFTKINNWSSPFQATYTHADIHYLRFYGDKLYCGSDGGIYVSDNAADSFSDKTASAQIGQFYRIAVSKQSAYKMVGGLQDNGGYAYSNNQWKNYYGADGMDTAIHPTNSNKYYGFIQGGGGLYVSNDGGNSLSYGVDNPGENGNWVTPLRMSKEGNLYAGYTNFFRLNNDAWEQVNNSTFAAAPPLDYIAIDPTNSDIIYVADEEILFKSTDGGVNFSIAYAASFNITSIAVHTTNSSIVYLTTQGTSGEALKSTDGGITFTSINEGLPDIGKNVIVHQGRNTLNPLYVGTSLGVYYRDDSMTQWEPFDTNLPNVSVTDLEVNLEDAKLVAATFGRGIWMTAIPVESPQVDVKFTEIIAPSSVNVNCNTSISPQIAVKNNGQNTITTVGVAYEINGAPQNYTWNGTIASGQSTTISLPTMNLSKGAYLFDVSLTVSGDAYSDNNSGQGVFFLNDSGTVNQVNPFETPADELLENDEGSATGLWTRGIRSGTVLSSGTNNVYATSLSGDYPDLIKSYLISECYDLTQLANPQIRFKMAYDLEENWDILYVQYSTDLGQNWEVLGNMQSGWYNSDRTPETTGNDCYNCVGAQWTGTDTTLTDYMYPLSGLNSETNIMFRFVFQSDQSVTNEGVIVDDFVITGTLESAAFSSEAVALFPNPTNGMVTVANLSGPIEQIEVYDVSGKKIEVNFNSQDSNNWIMDMTNLATGVYFVKIASEGQQVTKSIIRK